MLLRLIVPEQPRSRHLFFILLCPLQRQLRPDLRRLLRLLNLQVHRHTRLLCFFFIGQPNRVRSLRRDMAVLRLHDLIDLDHLHLGRQRRLHPGLVRGCLPPEGIQVCCARVWRAVSVLERGEQSRIEDPGLAVQHEVHRQRQSVLRRRVSQSPQTSAHLLAHPICFQLLSGITTVFVYSSGTISSSASSSIATSTSSAAPPIQTWINAGCASDYAPNGMLERTLTGSKTTDAKMTNQMCWGICEAGGFTIAGTQGHTEWSVEIEAYRDARPSSCPLTRFPMVSSF